MNAPLSGVEIAHRLKTSAIYAESCENSLRHEPNRTRGISRGLWNLSSHYDWSGNNHSCNVSRWLGHERWSRLHRPRPWGGASIGGLHDRPANRCPHQPAAQSTFLGDTVPSPEFGIGAVLLAEVIGTAILVFTIFGATSKTADPSRAGVTIGFALAAIVWMFGPISGASLNPARTWGPTFASAVFSLTPLGNLWIYIIGPVLGGLLGAFLYDALR